MGFKCRDRRRRSYFLHTSPPLMLYTHLDMYISLYIAQHNKQESTPIPTNNNSLKGEFCVLHVPVVPINIPKLTHNIHIEI